MFSATVISGNSARFWKMSAVGRLFGPMPRHIAAADPHGAFGRVEKARDGAQDRRLAAARGPEKAKNSPFSMFSVAPLTAVKLPKRIVT